MYNVLLGTAIGDSLGVHFEKRNVNDPDFLTWDGKTFLGSEYHGLKPGQWSDDTQFSVNLTESLIANNGFNPDDLSKRYVELFTSNTIRGYGRTTKLAIDRLIQGVHWSASGVVGSYGNGSAMRSAPFGVFYRHDLRILVEAVKVDSAITHASNEAEAGALAIAIAVYLICNDVDDANLISHVLPHLPDSIVKNKIAELPEQVASGISHQEILKIIGTAADVRQTAPAALYCYLKFNSFQGGVEAAIRAAMDADTTASITGALFGAKLGKDGISEDYYIVEDYDKLIDLDSKLCNRVVDKLFPRV